MEKKITQTIPINCGTLKIEAEVFESRTISRARKLFVYIDPEFCKPGLNSSRKSSRALFPVVHEMVSDGNFRQAFASISPDLEQLVWPQQSLIRFCTKYPYHLNREGVTLFLVKKEYGFIQRMVDRLVRREREPEYLVAYILFLPESLSAYCHKIDLSYVWNGNNRFRIIAPRSFN